MTDLSKLKASDTVKFRCGGSAIVGRCDRGDNGIVIYTSGTSEQLVYGFSGGHKFDTDSGTGPFDIIAIEPAPVPRTPLRELREKFLNGTLSMNKMFGWLLDILIAEREGK